LASVYLPYFTLVTNAQKYAFARIVSPTDTRGWPHHLSDGARTCLNPGLRHRGDKSRTWSAFGNDSFLRGTTGAVEFGEVSLHLPVIAQGGEYGGKDGGC
jgi:hypothetical protein